MVTIPFKLNLTIVGGAVVPGYENLSPAAYSALLGYGYEDAIDLSAFKRSVNPDEKYDTVHRLSASAVDNLRIDVPPGRLYEVLVMTGDPSASQNGQLIISDAGVDAVAFTGISTAAGETFAAGHILTVDNFLRIAIGKVVGGPYNTSVAFVHVYEAARRGGTLRSVTPASTRRVP